MTTHAIEASTVPLSQLEQLAKFTDTLPATSSLRNFLSGLAETLRSGEDVNLIANEKHLTPAQVGKMLGVSRVHVYKLMDRGALSSNRVGNDRRTTMTEVNRFHAAQENERKQLAQRMANPDETRHRAVAELSH